MIHKRSFKEKTIDYLLYIATFSGINFIAGSVVHALDYSLYNYILLFVGSVLTPSALLIRELMINKNPMNGDFWGSFVINLVLSISAGCITGGIIHLGENSLFSLYLVISGFIMSFATAMLYKKKPFLSAVLDYVLWIAMFSGMSFISGSVVHAANDWFNNFLLIAFGAILTPAAILLRNKLILGEQTSGLGKNFLILLALSLGVSGVTGGVIHFTKNMSYATILIVGGFILSYLAALHKNDGSLAELRSR